MRVLFYKGSGTLMDRAIRFWTQGKYSHVELQFSDGMCFSSSSRDGGTRFKDIFGGPDSRLIVHKGRWHYLTLDADEDRLRYWCGAHVGLKYDWLGILGFVFPWHHGERRRWYCSEICAAALRVDEQYRYLPAKLSPSLMYEMLSGDSRVR